MFSGLCMLPAVLSINEIRALCLRGLAYSSVCLCVYMWEPTYMCEWPAHEQPSVCECTWGRERERRRERQMKERMRMSSWHSLPTSFSSSPGLWAYAALTPTQQSPYWCRLTWPDLATHTHTHTHTHRLDSRLQHTNRSVLKSPNPISIHQWSLTTQTNRFSPTWWLNKHTHIPDQSSLTPQ